jgi:hypothetical protein
MLVTLEAIRIGSVEVVTMGKLQVLSVVRKNPFRNIRYAGASEWLQEPWPQYCVSVACAFQIGQVLLQGDVWKKHPITCSDRRRL